MTEILKKQFFTGEVV